MAEQVPQLLPMPAIELKSPSLPFDVAQNFESSFLAAELHEGHNVASSASLKERRSSNRKSHLGHTYSYMGISPYIVARRPLADNPSSSQRQCMHRRSPSGTPLVSVGSGAVAAGALQLVSVAIGTPGVQHSRSTVVFQGPFLILLPSNASIWYLNGTYSRSAVIQG